MIDEIFCCEAIWSACLVEFRFFATQELPSSVHNFLYSDKPDKHLNTNALLNVYALFLVKPSFILPSRGNVQKLLIPLH